MDRNYKNSIYSPVLPGMEPYATPKQFKNKKHTKIRDIYNLRLLTGLSSDGLYGLPTLNGFTPNMISKPLPFHEARAIWRKGYGLSGYFIHFYIEDEKFDCIRRNTDSYISMLKSADFVVAPDFSTYRNYPFPILLKNVYDNLLLAAYFEKQEVRVVANVVWASPLFYDATFSGQPKGSTIFVNSKSLRINDRKGVNLWLHGYKEAIMRLNPIQVVRFGKIVPGESEIYANPIRIEVDNPYIKAIRYGR